MSTFVVIWSYKPNKLKLWVDGVVRWKSHQSSQKLLTMHPEDNLNALAKLDFSNLWGFKLGPHKNCIFIFKYIVGF